MEPFVINIGRQLGSGGRAIGNLPAKILNINYYDREILLLAAKESGFTPEIFERNDEKNHFLRTPGNIIPFVGGSDTFYQERTVERQPVSHSERGYPKGGCRTFVRIHWTLCRLCAARPSALCQRVYYG